LAGVIGVPGVPSAEELSSLLAGDLVVRLAEAYRLIAELTAQAGRMTARRDSWGDRVTRGLSRHGRQ